MPPVDGQEDHRGLDRGRKGVVPLDLSDEQWIDLDSDPRCSVAVQGRPQARRTRPFPASQFLERRRPYPEVRFWKKRTPQCSSDETRKSCEALTRYAASPAPASNRCWSSSAPRAPASRRFFVPGSGRGSSETIERWLPLPCIRPERAAMSGKYGLARGAAGNDDAVPIRRRGCVNAGCRAAVARRSRSASRRATTG